MRFLGEYLKGSFLDGNLFQVSIPGCLVLGLKWYSLLSFVGRFSHHIPEVVLKKFIKVASRKFAIVSKSTCLLGKRNVGSNPM